MTDSPTFVVTSVPGAAAFWQRAPDGMLEAVGQYETLVREKLDAFKGREVRRSGSEGYLLAFDQPEKALSFALELTNRLLLIDWPEGVEQEGGLRASIGIDRGPAMFRDDPRTGQRDYFGPAVSRATELAARAGAGQILAPSEIVVPFSASMSLRFREEESAGVGIVDVALLTSEHGRMRPPQQKSERRTNLTRDKTSFVGRDEELQALYRLYAEGTQLVSIVGPGGIGKTRLARQFARMNLAEYEQLGGGVWFCDLTDAKTLDDVLLVIAKNVGVPLDGTREPLAFATHIGRALGRRGRLLLVVDNFEQVAQHAREVLGRFLEVAPDLRVLVTSRARLGLEGEGVLDLVPMREEDALHLFETRARSAGANVSLEGNEGAATRDIVRQLECMPLAIELAAARTRVLPPQVLKNRLTSGLDVLRGTGPDRHSTLRATVRWSWDLLSSEERGALAQCSVFHGGFTLEAAEAVLIVPEGQSVVDTLDSLVAKSLLRVYETDDGESRFGLFRIIREFAAERLSTMQNAVDVERKHSQYYVEVGTRWVDEMYGKDEVERFEQLRAELDNLRAIFQRSERNDPALATKAALLIEAALRLHGPFGPLGTLLDAALETAKRANDTELEARVQLALTRCRTVQTQYEAAAQACERALEIAKDPLLLADALGLRGHIHRFKGRITEARQCFDRGLEVIEQNADDTARSHAWIGEKSVMVGRLATLVHGEGRIDEARALYEQSLALHAVAGRRRYEAVDLAHFGLLQQERGELGQARELLQRAIDTHRAISNRRGAGIVTGYLALNEHEQGHTVKAKALLDEALAVHRESSEPRFEGLVIVQQALLAFEDGDAHEAEALFLDALQVAEAGDDSLMSVFVNVSLAVVRSAAGRRDAARASLAASMKVLAKGGGAWTEAIGGLAITLGLYTPEEIRAERERLEWLQSPEDAKLDPPRMIEARFGMRLLRRAFMQHAAALGGDVRAPLDDKEPTLELGPDIEWARPPGRPRIDLRRRRVLRRVLSRLVELRLEAPGKVITVEEALAAGWPGEVLGRDAAANRVRVAIATLRKLGLKDVVLTRGDCYFLDPAIAVFQASRRSKPAPP